MSNLTPIDLSNERLLVVSAHAADFVWRAGGAIALYGSRGAGFGCCVFHTASAASPQGLWKKEGMTLERVKQVRHEEAGKAAEVLSAKFASSTPAIIR